MQRFRRRAQIIQITLMIIVLGGCFSATNPVQLSIAIDVPEARTEPPAPPPSGQTDTPCWRYCLYTLLALSVFIIGCLPLAPAVRRWRSKRNPASLEGKYRHETEIANQLDKTDATLLFNEYGEWARHYSTVRMTVTTFFIGLVAAIMSFAESQDNANLWIAPGLWVAASVLFWAFSELEARASTRQRIMKRGIVGPPTALKPKLDWARVIFAGLTALFAFAWGIRACR